MSYVGVRCPRTGRILRYDTFVDSSYVVKDGELWNKYRLKDSHRFPGLEPEGKVVFQTKSFEESCRLEQVWEVLSS